jgi:predicted outer membrane lipoprotein
MRSLTQSSLLGMLLACAFSAASADNADDMTMRDERPALIASDEAVSVDALAADSDGDLKLSFGNPAGIDTLQENRGGSEFVKNEMRLHGTTAGNTADNVVTGANSIGTGAFANLSGIPIVIQNSGANVLIQNATILNLQLH